MHHLLSTLRGGLIKTVFVVTTLLRSLYSHLQVLLALPGGQVFLTSETLSSMDSWVQNTEINIEEA